MIRVTLLIEDTNLKSMNVHHFEKRSTYVLPLVFKAVDAAVSSYPKEVQELKHNLALVRGFLKSLGSIFGDNVDFR